MSTVISQSVLLSHDSFYCTLQLSLHVSHSQLATNAPAGPKSLDDDDDDVAKSVLIKTHNIRQTLMPLQVDIYQLVQRSDCSRQQF